MAFLLKDEVFIYQDYNLGIIKLNRPHALNALSLEMIREIRHYLEKWEDQPGITCVYITGEGDRAFCAGGDLKAFYRAGMQYRRGEAASNIASVYFEEEYALNAQIFHYKKPVVAFMNGITMGGGYGLAGNAKYRIVCEKTKFAMPEVGIGFFPDVGSLYHLSQCPKNFGTYLAMTGSVIEAGDMLEMGLAEYCVGQDDEEAFLIALKTATSFKDVEEVIGLFQSSSPSKSKLNDKYNKIETIFSGYDVLAYIERLQKDDSEWGRDLLKSFQAKSPTSVWVTAEYLKRAKKESFDSIIRTDLKLAQNFIHHRDLYEGIRAVIIEKDFKPAWHPQNFNEVEPVSVEAFFKDPIAQKSQKIR